jgi:NurA-like 5'-3' nuclease
MQKILKIFSGSFVIWGTGFLREPENNETFFRSDIEIYALRGKLSKKKVEILLKKELDVALGDPGILISDIIPKTTSKSENLVGIIPHFREQDNPKFKELKNNFENSILIDLKGDPISVLHQISACNYILSSSLHGLIIADSYLIPNLPIFVSNNVKGDGFKFRDYYSNFNMDYSPVLPNDFDKLSEDFIAKNYNVTESNVQDMKKALYNSFPIYT